MKITHKSSIVRAAREFRLRGTLRPRKSRVAAPVRNETEVDRLLAEIQRLNARIEELQHKNAELRGVLVRDLTKLPWKTEECGSPDCWCRIILPENPVDDQECVAPSGCVSTEVAEYIVRLHNERLGMEVTSGGGDGLQ